MELIGQGEGAGVHWSLVVILPVYSKYVGVISGGIIGVPQSRGISGRGLCHPWEMREYGKTSRAKFGTRRCYRIVELLNY